MGEDDMFRKIREKERGKGAGGTGSGREAAGAENKGRKVTEKPGGASVDEPLFAPVSRAVSLRRVLCDRVGIASFVSRSVQLCGRSKSSIPL